MLCPYTTPEGQPGGKSVKRTERSGGSFNGNVVTMFRFPRALPSDTSIPAAPVPLSSANTNSVRALNRSAEVVGK